MKKFKLMATGILVATLLIPTAASAKSVTVKSGDTLYRLAVNNKVSVSQIKSLNNLKNDSIYPGQVLKVTADAVKKYGIIADCEWLNIRKGPTTDTEIVTTIKVGTKVEILGTKGEWVLILVNGKKGYAHSGFVETNGKTVPVEAKEEINYLTLTKVSGLFKSQNNEYVSAVRPTKVAILETGTNGWYKVQTWLGPLWIKDGVMREENLTEYVSLTKVSALFKEQGKEYVADARPARLVVLAKGTDGWIKVQTWIGPLWTKNGITQKDLVPIPAPKPAPTPVIVTTKAKTTANLNLRSTASTSGTILKTIPEGTIVTVLSKSNSWWKLQYAGYTGYSSSTYLTTNITTPIVSPAVDSKKVFIRPADGIVTSEMGPRWGSMHYGLDIAKTGNVTIKAGAAGVVSRSYLHSSYGEVVFIKHEINGQKYETVYAHMRSLSRAVKVGDVVKEGQFLGWMGSTGNSTGQHLHFEVHLGDYVYGKTHQDPLLYIK
jgi:murein DD-endopeptidase MepM/ murein hydrolase activator NlpD